MKDFKQMLTLCKKKRKQTGYSNVENVVSFGKKLLCLTFFCDLVN